MKYEAVIIDLDGTLLNDNEEICSTNCEAIQHALCHGYKVTLASGRPHELMIPYVEQLQLTESIICCNGAYQYDPLKNEMLMEQALPQAAATSLLNLLNEGHFDFTLYCKKGVFAQKVSKHTMNLEDKARKVGIELPINIVSSLGNLITEAGTIYKVLVSSEDKVALCQLRDTLETQFSKKTFQADLSTPTKLDITSAFATKGNAAGKWLERQNITSNNAIAFGDGDNDSSLFHLVGEPVAMANASPFLKGLANLIVTNNNGCGIGQYLRLVVEEGQHVYQPTFNY
ncbi:Cof-type HAD-IIB family hydrolase [Aliivibrio fischeri]|uniref:Cof-type HAD-IIB family hydrolase n=1 Tax=Aliivibrio fischeri TaxID=668 RepID=UPI00084C889B|nr:Cof-type HAD-IIB family hydrolase [Aliivibrio fischeri]OED55530.1 hydrolase [Aliivibrio fischeri]